MELYNMKLPFLPTVLTTPFYGNSISMERAIRNTISVLEQLAPDIETSGEELYDKHIAALDDLELMLEGIERSKNYSEDNILHLTSNLRYTCKNQIIHGDNNE